MQQQLNMSRHQIGHLSEPDMCVLLLQDRYYCMLLSDVSLSCCFPMTRSERQFWSDFHPPRFHTHLHRVRIRSLTFSHLVYFRSKPLSLLLSWFCAVRLMHPLQNPTSKQAYNNIMACYFHVQTTTGITCEWKISQSSHSIHILCFDLIYQQHKRKVLQVLLDENIACRLDLISCWWIFWSWGLVRAYPKTFRYWLLSTTIRITTQCLLTLFLRTPTATIVAWHSSELMSQMSNI